MAWYYVKTGGTATGDGGRVTTQRTGAWSTTASEYYDSLYDADAATTPPRGPDVIIVSDISDGAGALGLGLNSDGTAGGPALLIVSVDDANQENYKPGAIYASPTGFNVTCRFNVFFAGVTIEGDSNGAFSILNSGTAGRFIKMVDGAITNVDTLGSTIEGSSLDGGFIELLNVTIDKPLNMRNGHGLHWRGGTFSLGSEPLIFSGVGAEAGATVIIEGVDISSATGSVLGAALSATTTDVVRIKLVNCQLNSSLTLPAASDLTLPQHRFEMWGCDDSTGGELFRYHMQDGTGKVVNNNSKFVTAESAWYAGSTKSSYEVSTTAECSHMWPFVFNLPIEYVDLTDTATDLIRVALTTSLTLTDTEIAAYLVYPDGTTSVQANWVTSGKTVGAGNYGVDPLDAGATLPTSSTAWTGALANKYQLDCDTSGDPGAVAPVSVRIEIYRASITNTQLFIATEYEKA